MFRKSKLNETIPAFRNFIKSSGKYKARTRIALIQIKTLFSNKDKYCYRGINRDFWMFKRRSPTGQHVTVMFIALTMFQLLF